MTALYSVNLRVMGRSNVPLLSVPSLRRRGRADGVRLSGGARSVGLLGWEVAVRDLASLRGSLVVAAAVAGLLFAFFRTNLGTAMRATGNNAQMIRALGVDTDRMTVAGLALANGLVGLSGALLAQYQGFADVQMGIGMVVWGLASVIIGEALVRSRLLGLALAGAVLGLRPLPPSRRARAPVGPRPERPQARDGRVRLRRPRPAAPPGTPRQAKGGLSCLRSATSRRPSIPGPTDEVRALRGVTLSVPDGVVRRRDRDERLGKVDPPERRGRDASSWTPARSASTAST